MLVALWLCHLSLLGCGIFTHGHMVMRTPLPFGRPNNSPLDADGADFPCKGGPYDRSSVHNVMAIGEPQILSFTGSVVHGGGSCQVALTTDLTPTAASKWMVIKSIEGGCPANVEGNLPTDPNGTGASAFRYIIPASISPGEYVIAWTWLNQHGNREFFMNCGPATITSPQKKRYTPNRVSLSRRQTSFPDLFVANMPGVNGCTAPEGFDYHYPQPGNDVETRGSGPYTTLTCSGNNPVMSPGPISDTGSTKADVSTSLSGAGGSAVLPLPGVDRSDTVPCSHSSWAIAASDSSGAMSVSQFGSTTTMGSSASSASTIR